MASDIVGSWFPTGYYGHLRNKPRNDFVCEYRQLARPQPPNKFIRRSMQPTSNHVFSHHDNQNTFTNDAIYFGEGHGRKRPPPHAYVFKPDFYTWMPLKEEIERSRPLISSYKVDFSECANPQLLIHRPKTSFDSIPTTTYRYTHGTASPNLEEINALNSKAMALTRYNCQQRALSTKRAKSRETVASCLSWYRPARTEATAITDYSRYYQSVPHSTNLPAVQQRPSPPAPVAPTMVQNACTVQAATE